MTSQERQVFHFFIKEIKTLSEIFHNLSKKENTIGLIIDVEGTHKCGKNEEFDFLTIIKVFIKLFNNNNKDDR